MVEEVGNIFSPSVEWWADREAIDDSGGILMDETREGDMISYICLSLQWRYNDYDS